MKIQVFNGTWLSDHEIVYVDQNGSIVIFDAETNKSSSMLVKTYDKTLHTMAGFKLSADRQSILFVSDMRHEFGSPISARYAIFNISSQTVEFLDDLVRSSNLKSTQSAAPNSQAHIQYAAWGPNSNSIVFIESNDIYYVPDFSSRGIIGGDTSNNNNNNINSNDRQQQPFLRLTKTGSPPTTFSSDSSSPAQTSIIRNGLPDTLYRANIFNQANEATLWWSPDGRYLAYLSFDDSQVEPNPIEFYDSYMHDGNNQPKIHYERYPRAGSMNPRVTVNVVDLSQSSEEIETSVIPAPGELRKQQELDPRLGYYVTYVGWLPISAGSGQQKQPMANQLLVMWSNRAQTSSMLTSCENTNELRSTLFGSRANSWKCDLLTVFSQRIPPSIDAKRTILSAVNQNGTRLVFFALPRPDSVIGDHYHVAMLRADDRAPKYLTHGEFDIDRLISYEPETDSLYFEVKISEIAERHFFRMTNIGQVAQRQIKCLTCELAEPCGYNYVHIAPGSKYLVHECLGPSIPKTRLRLLTPPSKTSDLPTDSYPMPESQTSHDDHHQVLPGNQMLAKYTNRSISVAQNNNVNATKHHQEPILKTLTVLGVNSNIENLVKTKQMPIEKFIAIKSNQQIPCDVYMKLYLPNEIEEEKDKRFPMLIESSEIDQRNVWKKFDLDWGKYLASKKQIIYAKMDCVRAKTRSTSSGGAGGGSSGSTSGLSSGSMGATYDDERMLDSPLFNAKDQVDAIKFLSDNVDLFPYIDRRRIAIWGPSSTSAYVALATTINDDSKLIQCTIAVSPITNWRYMSSYAAEHYLGLPWLDSNSLKYERANLLKRSYEFALRKLLIVHGTADEQVHVQHSMQFVKSLTEHHITGGALHQMQFYPDVGHSLDQVRRHYYLTLDSFVDRCFYQKPIAIKTTEWKGKVRPKLYK